MRRINYPSTGKIRIIGGQWKGRKLPVLKISGLRPTTDRVRETLFNWLSPSIVGSRCLDCFAGSGALGIEALSRNASFVTLLDIESRITWQLQQNLNKLKAANAKIINTNTMFFLTQPGIKYNIVFVDPPFRKGIIEETLSMLEKNDWLAEKALIYVESEVDKIFISAPKQWVLFRRKVAGQAAYRLYYKTS